MANIYSEDARKRIGNLGASEISEFLGTLSVAHRDIVLAILPRIDGFRKGSPAEIKAKTKALIGSITSGATYRYRGHEVEWRAFSLAWLYWANNIFSIKLDKFVGNSQIELAEHVVREVGELHCPREDLKKLLLFSSFSDDPDAERFVALRPGREELEKRREVAELPGRVQILEERLKGALSRIKEFENFSPPVVKNEGQDDAFQTLARKLEIVTKHIEEIEEKSNLRSVLFEKMEDELRQENVLIRNTERRHAGLLDLTIKEIESSKRAAQQLQASLQTCFQRLEELAKKVGETSRSELVQTAQEPKNVSRSDGWMGAIQLIRPVSKEQVRVLENIEDVLRALAENYCAIGIDKSDADVIAGIVTAGIVAGQLINFGGAMADLLADATSATLFASGFVDCHVPVGLADGAFIDECIQKALQEKSLGNVPIVMRGANRSAFEIYAGEIRKKILNRQVGRTDHLEYRSLFATACVGPSILDFCDSTFEIGPYIDTDHLRWSMPRWKKIKIGSVSREVVEGLFKPHDDIQDAQYRVDMVLNAEGKANGLRRIVLLRALTALAQIPNLNDAVAQEYLLAAWVMPRQRSKRVQEDVRNQLAQQATNGGVVSVNLLLEGIKAEL